jgi:hypothetical protein
MLLLYLVKSNAFRDHVTEIDPGSDFYWITEGVKLISLPRGEVGWTAKQLQRCYVEEVIRNETKSMFKNIEIRDGTDSIFRS